MNKEIKHDNIILSNVKKEISGVIFNKINKNDFEFIKSQVKLYLDSDDNSEEEFKEKTSIYTFFKSLLDGKEDILKLFNEKYDNINTTESFGKYENEIYEILKELDVKIMRELVLYDMIEDNIDIISSQVFAITEINKNEFA